MFLQISERSEPGSDFRLSDVCGEDYPAEQLSSTFQSPATASALIDETGKRGVSSRSDRPDLLAALSVPAPPDVLLLYWTLVKDGVLPGGYEAQFALLENCHTERRKESAQAHSRFRQPYGFSVAPSTLPPTRTEGKSGTARGRSIPPGGFGTPFKVQGKVAGEVLRWSECQA